jgi:hypothetical protein
MYIGVSAVWIYWEYGICFVGTQRICQIQWSEQNLTEGWGMFFLLVCQQSDGSRLSGLEDQGLRHQSQKPGNHL